MNKGAKTPKAKEKQSDDPTDREVTQTSKKTTAKDTETDDVVSNRTVTVKTKKTKGPQHIDDENFDLELDTGRFVKKKKKPVAVVPDDDDDIEMEDIDDEDKDQDYDPNKDDDPGDDDEEQNEEENADDDDFPIPPLRSSKTAAKSSDKSTSKRKKQKTSDDALDDLADFVEATFTKKMTRQGTRKVRVDKEDDACINPKEAARFRKAMRDEAQELENAVRKGVNVKEAYETLIRHVIEACKDMNYEIPTDIEAKDILPTIEDPTCRAWQLKLQGIQTAEEGELNILKADNAGICMAKKKFELKDIAKYMEEISADWPELK